MGGIRVLGLIILHLLFLLAFARKVVWQGFSSGLVDLLLVILMVLYVFGAVFWIAYSNKKGSAAISMFTAVVGLAMVCMLYFFKDMFSLAFTILGLIVFFLASVRGKDDIDECCDGEEHDHGDSQEEASLEYEKEEFSSSVAMLARSKPSHSIIEPVVETSGKKVVMVEAGTSNTKKVTSKKVNKNTSKKKAQKKEVKPEIVVKEDVSSKASSKGKFVGSRNGRYFHAKGSEWAEKIKEQNQIWFASRKEAEEAGYKPAKDLK